MALELNSRSDGFGYLYGGYTTGAGERFRVDIMPPKEHWQGDLVPSENPPHLTDWVIYIDGEEVARAKQRSDLPSVVAQRLVTSR